MYVTRNQQETRRGHHRQSFPDKKLCSEWYNLPVTQPAASDRANINKQQREKGKGVTVSSSNNNLDGGMCFYVSHHLYLELYEFSTIHATKMSKDFFFLYLAAPGTGHEQHHCCL